MNVLAFDEVIVGTSTIWYTPQTLNAKLGGCDIFAVHAFTTGVLGSSPTLNVELEHSGDDQHWTSLSEVSGISPAASISSDGSNYGYVSAAKPGRFVRAKITLGGTNPQCRLKLFITGRTFAS